MRHIKLVFVILHMPCGTCMNADRTFAIHDMLRQFGYLTDVSPRRFVVEQIVKALAHAPALKTVSIEWNHIAGWGNWEIKHLRLRPLERLMVHCVVEDVNLALPPTMDHNFYHSWAPQNRGKELYRTQRTWAREAGRVPHRVYGQVMDAYGELWNTYLEMVVEVIA